MKKLLFITTMLIALTSCSSTSGHLVENNTTARRVVRPAYGVNNNVKIIRNIDTLYEIGDTVRVEDIGGLSSINEVVIIK